MSYSAGLGSKGDKPAKGKFTSININNLYRGKSVETPKAAGSCIKYLSSVQRKQKCGFRTGPTQAQAPKMARGCKFWM